MLSAQVFHSTQNLMMQAYTFQIPIGHLDKKLAIFMHSEVSSAYSQKPAIESCRAES
jgi:hypothetical protein